MKSLKFLLACSMIAGAVGCTSTPSASSPSSSNTIHKTAVGYGGEINVDVVIEDGKVTDIILGENHETNVVMERAFPVIRERILEAGTPAVDSVSAATFSTYGIKQAVAEAMDEAGIKYEGEVTRDASSFATNPEKVDDVDADVVVIGGGPSGLAAAITIKQENADANVIVCEKLDILSGNGKFDMNYFDLINSQAQKEAGNEITKEEFYEQKKENGESDARIRAWVDNEETMDAWLRDMGVELNYNYGDTNHMAEEDQYAGEVIQEGMEKEAENLGITILTGTKGVDFAKDDDDNITGIVVENTDAETYTIHAAHSVIATGGFCSNSDLLAEYAPGYEVLNTSNQLGTTGDFVKVFEENDMQLDRMDVMSVFSNIINPRRDLTGGADMNLLVNAEGTLLNNNISGLDRGLMIQEQPNGAAFYITDTTGYESFYRIRKHVGLGYYETGETLEELADKLGIDPEGFTKTVTEFNERAKNGEEDPTLEAVAARELDAEGPYYGVKVEAANHMTKGGVVCDEHAQVLTNDGTAVNGLYAVGEVTAQGGGYSESVAWGRIAGSYIAEQLTK